MRPGIPFKNYSILACELFEARGHATIKSNPVTREGLVHSLGHGVGLHIHERPHSRFTAIDEERLDPGVIFTVEPGLYYPDRKMAVRLEDTYWARPDGGFEKLADYPMDLVLPMQKGRRKAK